MSKTFKEKIKILHMGDLHLDSPFSSLGVDKSEIRRREFRATFTSIMYYAKEAAVDLVLISGDLFDDGYATAETVELLCKSFAGMPDCRFVISPGNHDPYTRGSLYAAKKLPKNVYIFSDSILSRFVFEDLNTEVYGWAFCGDALLQSPLAGKTADNNGRLHLVCGHCDMTSPLSKYAPVTRADVLAFGAQYNGFSHVHKTPEVMREGKVVWSYSGVVEGRSFDECGEGGVNLIEAETTGDFTVSVKRIPTSRRVYAVEKLDVGGAQTLSDVAAAIDGMVKEKKYDEKTLLRVILTGAVSPTIENLSRLEGAARGLFVLEIKDETSPTFDGGLLEKDMTMRGELYRALLPSLTAGDAETRATAAEALQLGLAALEGRSLTD